MPKARRREAPNDEISVSFLTLSFSRTIGDAERADVDELLHARGASARWRTSARLSRSYALVEASNASVAASIGQSSDATVYDREIIALAVLPTVAQALPHVVEALSGSGRPAGVLRCTQSGDAAVVEWDPHQSSPALVFDTIDVELRRFASGRTVEILSPLTAPLVARVAAGGLGAPEIATDRILEELLARAGLNDA